MKIYQRIFLYCLSSFMFFIISTYCGLIPNNRVNIRFDSTKDFNLVEGITYKIVHLKSGFNLNINDRHKVFVTAPNDSNNQHWSLKKAGDSYYTYNIVSVGSDTNLDSKGDKKVCLSKKPKQHWIFTKVEDNEYNIAVNEMNLDSDGQDVYIGPSGKDNPYQRWSFEPINYKLKLVLVDFVHPPDLEDELDHYKTPVRFLNSKIIIKNPTNATIEQTIDKIETKSNSYSLEISKSEILRYTKTEKSNWSFGLGAIRKIFDFIDLKIGFNIGSEKLETIDDTIDTKETYKKSISREVSYHIEQKFTVPAFTSVAIDATVDKINFVINFTVKIRITGKADRMNDSGKVVSMVNVDADALRCYLQKDIKSEYTEENSEENFLIISMNAVVEVDGYGNIKVEAIPIPTNGSKYQEDSVPPESSESPKNPIILYQIVFTLLQIIMLQQIF